MGLLLELLSVSAVPLLLGRLFLCLVRRAEVTEAALEAAEGVGLVDKLGCPAGELSGGEARKLSVAIAFMGRPEVVFLDEPTSTMDPYSRRFTWDVIRKCRKVPLSLLVADQIVILSLLLSSLLFIRLRLLLLFFIPPHPLFGPKYPPLPTRLPPFAPPFAPLILFVLLLCVLQS